MCYDHPKRPQMNSNYDFHEIALNHNVINAMAAVKNNKLAMANMWFSFSSYMPFFLIQLSTKANSIQTVSKLISIANEELGDGDYILAHAYLFKQACLNENIQINQQFTSLKSLNILKDIIAKELNDSYILGIHLGLEIIANENITSLVNILGNTLSLQSSEFFRIHFVNEDDHIKKCVDNFNLCKSLESQNDFLSGFKQGLFFWDEFWKEYNYNV